jgi:hypothetical protein
MLQEAKMSPIVETKESQVNDGFTLQRRELNIYFTGPNRSVFRRTTVPRCVLRHKVQSEWVVGYFFLLQLLAGAICWHVY